MEGMATRRRMPPLMLPEYDFEEVPMAQRDLSGSVVVRLTKREKWLSHLSSLLLLCNEAANRRIQKFGLQKKDCADGTQTKPLGLEYMADRLDTDEPIWGYQVRTGQEGWLQGFITMTTFTVWQRNFRWDTIAPENGIVHSGMEGRSWDQDGALGRELEAQPRDGDPDGEGIIWPTVAELSLLGGLGCGRTLVKLVLEELEAGSQYDYVVLQATDNSVEFYESMGFIRVGAVARYRDEQRRVHLESTGPEGGQQMTGGARIARKKKDGKDEAAVPLSSSSSSAGLVMSGLPPWLQNKRFKFVVGGSSINGEYLGHMAGDMKLPKNPSTMSHEGEFLLYVEEGWRPVRGFRVFQRIILPDSTHRVREWRCPKETQRIFPQRFLPQNWRAKNMPPGSTIPIEVQFGQVELKSKGNDYLEIMDQDNKVTEAYEMLRNNTSLVAAGKLDGGYAGVPVGHGHVSGGKGTMTKPVVTGPMVDWNDHSPKNVAKRQEAGFVAYCHWTFPEQPVDDIYPSYMMARKLVKRCGCMCMCMNICICVCHTSFGSSLSSISTRFAPTFLTCGIYTYIHMCIYMYIYMYVCVCVPMHKHTHIYIYIQAYIHTCIHKHTQIYVYIYTHVSK